MKKEWHAPTGHGVNQPSRYAKWEERSEAQGLRGVLVCLHGMLRLGKSMETEGQVMMSPVGGKRELGEWAQVSSGLIKLNERERERGTVTTPWTHQCNGAVCVTLFLFLILCFLNLPPHTHAYIFKGVHKQASNICYCHGEKNTSLVLVWWNKMQLFVKELHQVSPAVGFKIETKGQM